MMRTVHGLTARVRQERGMVEIFVALILVALLGITALVVDVGNAKQTARNLQTASDSGSMAGAQQLATSVAGARMYAADYAFDSMNEPRGVTVSCPADQPSPGTTVCYQSGSGPIVYVTTPYTVSPPPADGSNPPADRQINVKICQTVQTTFARVIGINSTRPCKSATAVYSYTGNCVLCVMDADPNDKCTFQVGGNGTMNVTGDPPGPVTVNSPNDQGVCGGGSTVVNAPGGFYWVGCTDSPCQPKHGSWNPVPVNGPPVVDPLADVPVPSVTASGSCTTSGNTETCTPGIYSTLTPLHNGTTTLQPGIYVITDSIPMKQNDTLLGTGVMIYFACSNYPTPCQSGESGGHFSGNGGEVGTPSQPLSAPTSGTYKGLLIFADRNNTAELMGVPQGGSNGNIEYNLKGTIYGLNASVHLGGTAGQTLDSRVVIGKLDLQGNPNITDVYADQYQGNPTQPTFTLVG